MKYLLTALISACLLLTACKSPELAAYKVTAGTILTVDKAMLGWGDYVRSGKPSSNEVAQVGIVYNHYRDAVLVEQAAIIAYKTSGNTNALWRVVGAVASSSAEVISLVEHFLPPDKLVTLKSQ